MRPIQSIQNGIFKLVHGNNLVYNVCWEDPRCDRQMMQFDSESEIIMITSAGCNALDYLLDNPAAIHCIDLNYRQNAVLDLKMALIKNGDYELLWNFFGNGSYENSTAIYEQSLRQFLRPLSRKFWDKEISYFSGKGMKKSYFFQGTSGTVAWFFKKYLKSKQLNEHSQKLLAARDLETQMFYYQKIEKRLLSKTTRRLMNSHLTMSMLGVPKSQQLLFQKKYENGATGYILECLRKVFTERPVSDNYFYKAYFEGKYSKDCCPEYLKEKNFKSLRENISKIQFYTDSISGFLKKNPKDYSHYILLDHQDWLAANDVEGLAEEWDLILKNSRLDSKILLRSAAHEPSFIPDFVENKVTFEQKLTAETHAKDRVGTYASVRLAIVKNNTEHSKAELLEEVPLLNHNI